METHRNVKEESYKEYKEQHGSADVASSDGVSSVPTLIGTRSANATNASSVFAATNAEHRSDRSAAPCSGRYFIQCA